MTIYTLAEKIGLPEEAIRLLDKYPEVVNARAEFFKNQEAFCGGIKSTEDYHAKFLALFTQLAVDSYDKYVSLGICDDIYYDTMRDITVWCGNCLRDSGVYGLAEIGWLKLHVANKIYKLGRLQFEPIGITKDIELEKYSASAGEVAFYVHVPQGAPLTYEECVDSYERAVKFYRGINNLFYCHSWLLSPKLCEMLPPTSNIIRFQSHFETYGWDGDDRQCEERVYSMKLDDPSGYPENTYLQRQVKQYLGNGGKPGTSEGIFRFTGK